MDLKKKIVRIKDKIKTEIKENPEASLVIASQAIGFAALGVAWIATNKLSEVNRELDRERVRHADCREFARWVVLRTKENGGSEKLIKAENGMIHINDKSKETTED